MTLDVLFIALRELRQHVMRSVLTALGIIIGVAAVIIIVTLGGGATQSVTEDISSLGRNLLIVHPGAGRGGPFNQAKPFSARDVEAVRREIRSVAAVAPAATSMSVAVYGNENWRTNVIGGTTDYLTIRDLQLAGGRVFSEAEERSGRAVCLLGETVRQKLFGAQDPEGARLRLDKISCTVIGVFASKGAATLGQDQDDVVIMPIRTVQRRITGNDNIGMIFVSAEDSADTASVRGQIEQLLRARRNIAPGAENDFEVNDVAEIAGMVERITGMLTAFLSAIAAVSLIVGGIGIMNIMLVSVTERTREIGIRLAIGALERDVLMQFLIEAMLLALAGGIIGVVLGILVSLGAAILLNVPFVLNIPLILVAVSFSAVVGIAFGYFPARRAARLDPIEALRYE